MNGQDFPGARRDLRAISAPRRTARLPLRLTFLERVESSSKSASLTQWLRISQPPMARTNSGKILGTLGVVAAQVI